jgi:hypothetical protein
MVKLSGAAQNTSTDQPDHSAMQGSNDMHDVQNLAQLRAELSYLNRLDERRALNVASLKRLKDARDALLDGGGQVAGNSMTRTY